MNTPPTPATPADPALVERVQTILARFYYSPANRKVAEIIVRELLPHAAPVDDAAVMNAIQRAFNDVTDRKTNYLVEDERDAILHALRPWLQAGAGRAATMGTPFQWISCKERMPTNGDASHENCVLGQWRDGKQFVVHYSNIPDPDQHYVAWAKLPEPYTPPPVETAEERQRKEDEAALNAAITNQYDSHSDGVPSGVRDWLASRTRPRTRPRYGEGRVVNNMSAPTKYALLVFSIITALFWAAGFDFDHRGEAMFSWLWLAVGMSALAFFGIKHFPK